MHATAGAVGRKKQFDVRITLPLSADMAERIDAARDPKEARLDLIREALEAELRKRERSRK